MSDEAPNAWVPPEKVRGRWTIDVEVASGTKTIQKK